MILQDTSNPFEPIEVARKKLPYSFDVTSIKGPTSHQTQQANITSFYNVRCRAEHPCPAATIQLEDSTLGMDALSISPASDAHDLPISDRNGGRVQSCHEVLVGQQTLLTSGSPSLIILNTPYGSPHILTDAQARANIAEREVKINYHEMKIRELKATFEADSQEKYAAIKDYFNSRILAIQREVADRLNDVLGRAPSGSGNGGERDGEGFPCPEVRTLNSPLSH